MSDVHAQDFSSIMLAVAAEVLGEAQNKALSTKKDARFGSHGSFSVDTEKGTWYSHEENQGGGVLDLLKLKLRLEKPEALEWLKARKFLVQNTDRQSNNDSFNIVATYDYLYPSGELVCQVCRLNPKSFRQRRPDSSARSGWTWKTAGIQIPIYRLPKILDAIRDGKAIYIAEGEKGVDALVGIGADATCSPGGAGKWKPHHTAFLAGADCVILPDNDDAGRDHADKVLKAIKGVAKSVRIITLPGLPDKGDPYDWVNAGGTLNQLRDMLAATEPSPKRALPKQDEPLTINGYPFTEDGIALAFAAAHQDQLRYDHTKGSWFVWTGKAWRQDETKVAFSWSRRICRDLSDQALKEGKPKSSLSKASTAGAVERFALSDPSLAVTSVIWDQDIFLLGTPGGTVDLKTGILRAPSPDDYITKLTAITPSLMPDCPLWDEFMREVTAGDVGLIRFLKQWCGYCLTGDIREQSLVFAYGPGGNGKGVFLNTISKILGDYCRNAAMDTFTASSGDKHPTDLAMLRGARMVTASETDEGRAWAESRIKQMTGGDPITARFMRQDFFEYIPHFKLTMIGNHKPLLRNVGDAEKRRFNMVPFLFKPSKVDHKLEEKLKAEWPAILRWMIEGCLDWDKNGLKRPTVLTEATTEYLSEQDSISLWIEQSCEVKTTHYDTVLRLFESWTSYARANGEKPGSSKWFVQTLVKLGFERLKNTPCAHSQRGIGGVRVLIEKPQDRTQSRNQSDPEDGFHDGWDR